MGVTKLLPRLAGHSSVLYRTNVSMPWTCRQKGRKLVSSCFRDKQTLGPQASPGQADTPQCLLKAEIVSRWALSGHRGLHLLGHWEGSLHPGPILSEDWRSMSLLCAQRMTH